jgi:ParB-like chromosome segregation protein Spo0J
MPWPQASKTSACCIRPDGTLIAGARRLAAAKQLGWTEVPVRVVDLTEIVRGEYAENAHRKDFLPTEIDAIRRAIEPVEKAAAKERMTLGKLSTGSVAGKTRDKVGEFAGVSGKTVEKIAAVVKAAEKHPKKYGHLPEQMDKTRKVDKAYREVQRPTHDALGHPYEPGERKKPLHGFARIRQAIREERDRLVVEQREDPDQVPTLRKSLDEIEEQAGDDRFVPERLEPVIRPEPAPEQRFENPEDEPVPSMQSPPTAPTAAPADTRTPSEIMGDLIPEVDRRGGRDPWATKPKPSIDPEALQELIDAGVDPDEAMEHLQEQADRWS